jgi:hypothetical protein
MDLDLDLSSVWMWTLPLWGLFLLVFYLGGVLTVPTSIPSAAAAARKGASSVE